MLNTQTPLAAPKTMDEFSVYTLRLINDEIQKLQIKDEKIHQAVSLSLPSPLTEKAHSDLKKIDDARKEMFDQVNDAINIYQKQIADPKTTAAARKDAMNELEKNVKAADSAYIKKCNDVFKSSPELREKFVAEFNKNYVGDYSQNSPVVANVLIHNNQNKNKLAFDAKKEKSQSDLIGLKEIAADHKKQNEYIFDSTNDSIPQELSVAKDKMIAGVDASISDYEKAITNARNTTDLQAAAKQLQEAVNKHGEAFGNAYAETNFNDKQQEELAKRFKKEYPDYKENMPPIIHDVNKFANDAVMSAEPASVMSVGNTIPPSVNGFQPMPSIADSLQKNKDNPLYLEKDGWKNISEKNSGILKFANEKLHAEITIGKDTVSGKCTGSDEDRKAMYAKMADSMVAAGYDKNGKEVVINVKDEKHRDMFVKICEEKGLKVKVAEEVTITASAEKKSAVAPPEKAVVPPPNVNPDSKKPEVAQERTLSARGS